MSEPTSNPVVEVSESIHRKAKPCRKCRIRTHHTDSKGRPLCADCIVASKRPDPKEADWMPGKAAYFKEDSWN